jgi:protein TonB
MRICLIISFLFHVLLFMIFQKSFPSPWAQGEYRSYRVDLVRPSVEGLEEGDIPEPETAQVQKEQTPPDEESATISLETKDERYVSYTKLIKEKILKSWDYPREARRKKMEGKVFLTFTLERSGDLALVKIHKGSGYHVLDQEAKRAIFDSAPFPPFPERIPFKRLHIKAAFAYQLSKKK